MLQSNKADIKWSHFSLFTSSGLCRWWGRSLWRTLEYFRQMRLQPQVTSNSFSIRSIWDHACQEFVTCVWSPAADTHWLTWMKKVWTAEYLRYWKMSLKPFFLSRDENWIEGGKTKDGLQLPAVSHSQGKVGAAEEGCERGLFKWWVCKRSTYLFWVFCLWLHWVQHRKDTF